MRLSDRQQGAAFLHGVSYQRIRRLPGPSSSLLMAFGESTVAAEEQNERTRDASRRPENKLTAR